MTTDTNVVPFQPQTAVESRPSELRRDFTTQDVAALASTIAHDLTAAELRVVIEYARRTGLDPVIKEFHVWKDKQGMHIAPGIDGLRRRAMESGKFEGITKEWCGKDGVWTTTWLSDEPSYAARCTIYRKGFKAPFIAVALMKEFRKTGENATNWNQRPNHMIGICVERHCFRMSFPQEFAVLFDAIPPQYRGRPEVYEENDDDAIGAAAIAAPANVDTETGEIRDDVPPTGTAILWNDATGEVLLDASDVRVVEPAPAPQPTQPEPAKATAKRAPKSREDEAQQDCWESVKTWATEHGTDPQRFALYLATDKGVPPRVSIAAMATWLAANPEQTYGDAYDRYVLGEGGADGTPDIGAQGSFE